MSRTFQFSDAFLQLFDAIEKQFFPFRKPQLRRIRFVRKRRRRRIGLSIIVRNQARRNEAHSERRNRDPAHKVPPQVCRPHFSLPILFAK
jgi:hypothetical protein